MRKEIVPPPPPADRAVLEPDPVRVVTFLWDGNSLAQEIDTARGKRVFVHGVGSLVPILQQEQGEVLTYVNDHLGTPKELLDASGRVVWSAAHSAWGKVVDVADGEGKRPRFETPFRLLGQYHDDETGLCYVRYRYFDPETARWLSPDPLGIIGGTNLFAFDGSPTHDVDPLGLCTKSNLPGPDKPSKGTGEDYDKAKGQGIYVLLDEEGNVRYVGRGDAPARLGVHAETTEKETVDGDTTVKKKDLDPLPLWDNNLSKEQAKGMEQRLMDYFGGPKSMTDDKDDTQLLNRINSFGDTNDNAGDYRKAVTDEDLQEALARIQAGGGNTTPIPKTW